MERLVKYVAVIVDVKNPYPGREELPLINSSEDLEREFFANRIPKGYEGMQIIHFSFQGGDTEAELIGKGYFFDNDWSSDGTVSFVKPLRQQ